jgi:hypothetical protein
MSARRVHALLAAGVENPLLIEGWERDPRHLLALGVAPDSIDLAALRKFTGLTAKVRHNGLRQDLPLTFRLLHVAGLEIEVFAAYAAFTAARGRGFAPTVEARARDLIAFLAEWLDPARPEHVLLWDLVRHEDALARVTRIAPPAATTANGRITARSVLRVRGHLELHEMRSDPRRTGRILLGSRPDLARVPFGTFRLGYWRPENARESQILELDEFGICALSLVDGAHTAADLSRALSGARRPSRAFLELLAQLARAGIIGT